MRSGHQMSTAEFSPDGELWPMDYLTYLGFWANRMNGRNVSGPQKYIVINHMRYDHNYVTLVEIMKEEE
jgi:hypothetical protein